MPEPLAQVFSCEFYGISKNTLFYRTSLVVASALLQSLQQLISYTRRGETGFFAHFQQVHGTGKLSGITSLEVFVETNISSSVN